MMIIEQEFNIYGLLLPDLDLESLLVALPCQESNARGTVDVHRYEVITCRD
jgi:hypothetical protein